ncbi:MAG: hypothetical protein ACQKBV_01040 [Puniceicoccales bacterium]
MLLKYMPGSIYRNLAFCLVALFSLTALASAQDESAISYEPNLRLQEFYESLPTDLRQRIKDYREKSETVKAEVARYNEMPRNGLPPDSFSMVQRRRMKIETQMAALRLEQKQIAKEFYDLRANGWEPPNNSNIVRLLVAEIEGKSHTG